MRLSDQIVNQLRALIEQGYWQPGQRLPAERQLAQRLDVSRPSLREAIQKLASQGVLESRRGDGTYVQQQPVAFLLADTFEPLAKLLNQNPAYRYDILETRNALESSTAWHAALRATQADKDRIQRCFDDMVRHQRSGSNELSARADAQFHLAIAEASHNVVLLRVMHSLFELLLSSLVQSRSTAFTLASQKTVEVLTEQHYNLMQAIINGNPQLAQGHIGQHLDYVNEAMRRRDEDDRQRARYDNAPDSVRTPALTPSSTQR
ncbi:MAG TPA: transcriptional regulator LldR [Alcaligenes sp.]|nr:transcriptional regulator LldR [Alcaligenes sp.]